MQQLCHATYPLCPKCNDGYSTGALGLDGWFLCAAGHDWKFECPHRRCDAAVRLRREKGLVCKRGHEVIIVDGKAVLRGKGGDVR